MIKISIKGKVPVVFFREERMIIVYSPALDLSTCGKTIPEAQKNFSACLKIYLAETIKHGTLEKDLLKLGWKSNPEKLAFFPSPERYKSVQADILKRAEIPIPVNSLCSD
jgi:hypothetical protein